MTMRRLSFPDRYLTVLIALAMGVGILLDRLIPTIDVFFKKTTFGTTNLPIAIGLVLMMYPPLAKVRYERMREVFADRRRLILSMVQNWIIGPALMFLLGLVFLRGHPDYLVGLCLIGSARCIAMVVVWIDLADGDSDQAAGLVALNSIFQIIAYSAYATLFVKFLMPSFGIVGREIDVRTADIALSVAIYLGIPFVLGFLTRRVLLPKKGADAYGRLMQRISPLTLAALLFTIVLMFASQGRRLIAAPHEVALVAAPLVLYFAAMFFFGYFSSRRLGAPHRAATTLAFTAAGNNFELAIAVAVAVYGIDHGAAFAAVIGPLVEVPVMILLVQAAHRLERRFARPSSASEIRSGATS